MENPLRVENVDWRWAMIYCALTLTPKEIVGQKLQQVMPKKLAKGGHKPSIKTVTTDQKKERWHYPTPPEKLDQHQKKALLAAVILKLAQVILEKHVYEWNGDYT